MSNHFSAANLRFPGDDARLDLTDLFVFQSPVDPEKTVFIIDVNPFMTGSVRVRPTASPLSPRTRFGSMWTPGPIVVDSVTVLRYFPFTEEGLALRISSTTAR